MHFALLVVLALGQADGGAGVLTKAPTLVRQVEARYPPSLADAGVSGTVVMELDLGADGKVLDVRVSSSAGADFDQAALEARGGRLVVAEVGRAREVGGEGLDLERA